MDKKKEEVGREKEGEKIMDRLKLVNKIIEDVKRRGLNVFNDDACKLVKEIEQLRKEREWLLNSYADYREHDYAYKTEVETKADILSEMQQVLKEK